MVFQCLQYILSYICYKKTTSTVYHKHLIFHCILKCLFGNKFSGMGVVGGGSERAQRLEAEDRGRPSPSKRNTFYNKFCISSIYAIILGTYLNLLRFIRKARIKGDFIIEIIQPTSDFNRNNSTPFQDSSLQKIKSADAIFLYSFFTKSKKLFFRGTMSFKEF